MTEKGEKAGTETTCENKDAKKSNASASFWEAFNQNPEQAVELVDRISNKLIDLAERYIKFKEGERDHERKMEQVISTHSRRTLLIGLIGIVTFGVIIGILVLYKVVSADAFLFYVGVVMGFLLSLIRREMIGYSPESEDDGTI